MEEKNVDQEIKASLLKNTNDATRNKEELWNEIESKLNLNLSEVKQTNKVKTEGESMEMEPRTSRQKKRRFSQGWLTGTVAAAILVGIFTTSTDTGQAFVNNVKEYFAPEKVVVEGIEGIEEEKEVVLQESKSGYIFYIDEERYKLIEEDGLDKIVLKEELDEKYPEVSMTIKQIVDKTPEELSENIYAELKKSYTKVDEKTSVTDPIASIHISAISGIEWNSPVEKVYILSNEKEGSFVVRQKYFLEAEEGHGARFYHMLKEFKIVDMYE